MTWQNVMRLLMSNNTKKQHRLHMAARFLDVALGYLAARTCELHGWLLNWRVIESNTVVLATLWILFSVALIWVTNRLHKLAPGDHKDKTLAAWNELAKRDAKNRIEEPFDVYGCYDFNHPDNCEEIIDARGRVYHLVGGLY